MRSGLSIGRVIPFLLLSAGPAAAADPPTPPDPFVPARPVVVPPITPKAIPDFPDIPYLDVPRIAPAEPGPAPTPPKSFEPIPLPKDVLPPPPPVDGGVKPAPVLIDPGPPLLPGPGEFLPAGPPIPIGRTWARAEYLFWDLTGGRVPPLILTGPPGTPIGVPGSPGSIVLFGAGYPLDEPRSGARLTIGNWLDCTHTVGVEASGFWLDRSAVGFTAVSPTGAQVIASSPFIDPTGLVGALPVAFPGVLTGWTDVAYVGHAFWGAEALGRSLLIAGGCWRLDGLVGYRYRGYTESLDIRRTVVPLVPPLAPGSVLASSDTIDTGNEFHGGLIGVDCQVGWGCWELNVRPTIAIGRMENSVTRNGWTLVRAPGLPEVVLPVGFYNQLTNLGEAQSSEWTVVPELDVRVSKHVWHCVRVSVGYSLLYFPMLARAGEQIDPVFNPALLRPGRLLERSPACLHGLTVGLEVRF